MFHAFSPGAGRDDNKISFFAVYQKLIQFVDNCRISIYSARTWRFAYVSFTNSIHPGTHLLCFGLVLGIHLLAFTQASIILSCNNCNSCL